MAPAVSTGIFTFTSRDTIKDLLLVAEALRKSGQTPTLRFVQSYNESIESVAVDVAAEEPPVIDLTKVVVASLKESARPTEMAVAGAEDEVPDPAEGRLP